ncbi:hypothetical protein NUW58_g6431 [Xylaria curta]|uniref:Uncharacterized protein n=1 Tax=Xylaria curta TaxID=42375 RepID=A0ACC1NVH6_9PEZI|nr:hypothetical protein NUW58_g6431 [Xylaria curta]
MAKTQHTLDLDPTSLFDEMQVRLFDQMHRLAGLRVSGQIETPQLVVVGAQSSGKSSVLEALVRFHFPVDSNKPTTRFPIKLVLRKADSEMTQVKIEPGNSRSKEQKRALRHLGEELSLETFGNIMKKAKAGLDISTLNDSSEIRRDSRTFCDDILVIERYGPSLPQLSLVDLPGLFDAASAGQTLEDGDMISRMVSEYVKSPRNIILLVVSAEVNDYSNVPALGMIQRMLKEDTTIERRALCVVTRPDTAGSLDATQRVLSKENPFSESFARPWHVVRNQDQNARGNRQSLDDRDRIEEQFFRGPDWEVVPSGQKGIHALRETLKSMIWSHTQDQLPHVIYEVEDAINAAEARLDSTVRARATPEARRDYLATVAEKFAFLTREAVKGTYENEACDKDHETGEACQTCEGFFAQFGENDLKSQQKRLRANVRALNQAFAIAMSQYGKTKVIAEVEGAAPQAGHLSVLMSQQSDNGEHPFQPHDTMDYYKHNKPEVQGRKEYNRWVRSNMDCWTARGPRGEPSDGAYSGLFAYQAKEWKKIAKKHMKAVWLVVGEFIELALVASCPDRDVLAELRRELVTPNLRKIQLQADRALRDLVGCHNRSSLGFYDSFIEARVVREHTNALLRRLDAMGLRAEGGAEPVEMSATSSTEQADPPQGNEQPPQAQNHEDPNPQAQQANSQPVGKHEVKDHNQKDGEAILTSVLENVTAMIGIGHPFIDNTLVRKTIVPMISRLILKVFDPDSDSSSQEKTSIQRTVEDLDPYNSKDPAATRVVEQVEMHYEVEIPIRNPFPSSFRSSSVQGHKCRLVILIVFQAIRASFVGYVASLVVEQKVMGQLSEKIITQTHIRGMDDKKIEGIAGERPDDAKKRQEIERDLNTMRDVLKTMEDYRKASHHDMHK